jgi:isopentenyl-diphosphate delta-isomerase
MAESTESFEKRKREHISLALRDENEAQGFSQLEQIELIHEALPELDFDEVSLHSDLLSFEVEKPLLISSMTAGHVGSVDLNRRLAKAAQARGWLMGVGSQRRELNDSEALLEWKTVRKEAPTVRLLGNLGITQLIQTSTDKVKALVDGLEASAMIIHLNALQECFQPEGTPQFKGGLKALERLARELPVPVVVKETGCGFSEKTLIRLKETGVRAVDVSGLGGTHWGRIEGQRAQAAAPMLADASDTFKNWGISTVESLQNATNISASARYEVWASGGVRSGLDAARLFAMGARCVGFAKPILQAALVNEETLLQTLEVIEHEIKVALFCTGSKNLEALRAKKVWKWRQK